MFPMFSVVEMLLSQTVAQELDYSIVALNQLGSAEDTQRMVQFGVTSNSLGCLTCTDYSPDAIDALGNGVTYPVKKIHF